MSEKQKNHPPPTGRILYIVGSRRLQNELIYSYLERETGNVCFVLEDINQIPKYDQKDNDLPRLVLWDCQGKDLIKLQTELLPYVNQKQPVSPIILFNVSRDLKLEKKFILEGIQGLFYENDPLDIFLKGVHGVLDGKLWLSREVMTKCIFEGTEKDKSSKSIAEKLTERQTEILALVAVGSTNDEIADKLCISPHTVKSHLYNIFKKINVPNRIQAALWAAKNL